MFFVFFFVCFFCVQAEYGIRDLVRSRGLGDVYKRQVLHPQALGRPPQRRRSRGVGRRRPLDPRVVEGDLSLIHI